jgi:hypothetical protein
MPILEALPVDVPLDQGDLLRGVKLCLTGKTDTVEGGECAAMKTNYCLVLSRPCVIAHKPTIVVAAVEQYKDSSAPPQVNTFSRMKLFLEELRDGARSPDQFYLGQLPGDDRGRYAARFDSIHTIQVSSKPELRAAFVARHRIARLDEDFRRDLHTRLFQAFATLGFDDIRWYSSADLRSLVQTGRAEIESYRAEITRLEAVQEAEGNKANQINEFNNKIASVERQMAVYVAEVQRREVAPPG